MPISFADSIRSMLPWGQDSLPRQRDTLAQVRAFESTFGSLSNEEIRSQVDKLRDGMRDQELWEEPRELFRGLALFQASAARVVGIRYYDVQLMSALALTRNTVAEMATGEGKTFVGALAAFIHALSGRGVHVMTTNAYLAERDWAIVAPIFTAVGMRVGLLRDKDTPIRKKAMYDCDITYGPGYEFGFDYLRDQLSVLQRPTTKLGENYRRQLRGESQQALEKLQRGHLSAIVDEADSVFIDEANTPLLLSGPSRATNPFPQIYELAIRLVDSLTHGVDYVVRDDSNAPKLTEMGLSHVMAKFDQVAETPLRQAWPGYVEQALVAATRLKRDVHYIVDDNEIRIVDSSTGRILSGRTWRDGLHQMVEAKEGVLITPETNPLARISRQQYFQLYERLCGMTGTARDSERELAHFYKLRVKVIPTRRPCIRQVMPTRFFATADAKWQAIVDEVAKTHELGRPVLVGTRTIEVSEELASRLRKMRLPFQLLNGKQDAAESAVVAQAGHRSAITVATNMAGRGTDIRLDQDVIRLGGLHVVVSEPHGSRRVDRQLVGRAARQGDPGSCQMFVSADDALFVQAGDWLGNLMRSVAGPDGEVRDDLSKALQKIQQKVERLNYEKRRQLIARDAWYEEVQAKVAGDRIR